MSYTCPFLHPKHETIPIHFCRVFVVTVPWHKQNFHWRFKRDTRLAKGWNDICWTIHMFEYGLMFWVKEWTFKPRNVLFLLRNGLIEHIGCKAGAMALSFIQCSHSHEILFFLSYYIHMFLSWPFRDINKLFIDVLRGIQGLSKAEMTCVGQLTCLNNFAVVYPIRNGHFKMADCKSSKR
jgi:hypothetical protein